MIIDFNDDFRGLGNNLYGLDHLKGLKSLRDISELKKLYSEDMMNKLERAKMLDNDRLLWSKEKSDKYMEHSRKLLDDAQSHQKELLDKMQWKLADDMDARKFLKMARDSICFQGKASWIKSFKTNWSTIISSNQETNMSLRSMKKTCESMEKNKTKKRTMNSKHLSKKRPDSN